MNTNENEDDEIDQGTAMPTETFDDDELQTDAAMQEFTSRAASRRKKATADYWAALEALVLRDKLTTSEREQQFDKLDDIRLLLSKSEQDVRRDFEALREFIVASDAAEQASMLDEERKRRAAVTARLHADIEDLRRQVERKQGEVNEAVERANRLADQARAFRTEKGTWAHKLKQCGLDEVETVQKRIGPAPKTDRTSKWRFDRLRESLAAAGYDLDSKTWRT